jgi:hypothetical protein
VVKQRKTCGQTNEISFFTDVFEMSPYLYYFQVATLLHYVICMDPTITIQYPTESAVVAKDSQCEVLCRVFLGPQHFPASVVVGVDGLDGGSFLLPASMGANNYTFTLPPLPIGQHSVLLSLLVQDIEASSHTVSFSVTEQRDSKMKEKPIEVPFSAQTATSPATSSLTRDTPASVATAFSVRISSPLSCAIIESDSFPVEVEASFPSAASGDTQLVLVINGHEQPLPAAPRAAAHVTAMPSGLHHVIARLRTSTAAGWTESAPVWFAVGPAAAAAFTLDAADAAERRGVGGTAAEEAAAEVYRCAAARSGYLSPRLWVLLSRVGRHTEALGYARTHKRTHAHTHTHTHTYLHVRRRRCAALRVACARAHLHTRTHARTRACKHQTNTRTLSAPKHARALPLRTSSAASAQP